ncbi:hypothetical protein FRC01_007112 [Tulasnella sp. 417]|nr:hypothetical protein FRC01_007112 [Tulasnella sp. 417]
MASANETSLPKGLESVLAKFVVQGQIDSKSSLDIAIRDLLEALRSANTDVASLLTAVTCRVDGLLEVVIASKSGAAFAFRSRILKALQKSTEYPKPIFITCTELIGAFLISGSSSVTVDQDVVDKHRKFSGEFPLHGLVEPSTTTLPGMHDSRASSVSLKNQAKGRHSNKSKRSTTRVVQQAPSPAIDSSERSATPSEQLEGCLEVSAALI